jgi:hypothetical protein
VQTYLQSLLSPPQQPQPSSSSGLLSSLFTKKQPTNQQRPPAASTSVAQDAPLLSSQNINALYSLLDNRYQKEFPLPPSLRRPASNPEYYDNLLREFEEAPNRSWAGRVMKRVTGSLRLK